LIFIAQLVESTRTTIILLTSNNSLNMVSFQTKSQTKFTAEQKHSTNMFLRILITRLPLGNQHTLMPHSQPMQLVKRIHTTTAPLIFTTKKYSPKLQSVMVMIHANSILLTRIFTKRSSIKTWHMTVIPKYGQISQISTKVHVVLMPLSTSSIHAWSHQDSKKLDKSTVSSSGASLFSFISSF